MLSSLCPITHPCPDFLSSLHAILRSFLHPWVPSHHLSCPRQFLLQCLSKNWAPFCSQQALGYYVCCRDPHLELFLMAVGSARHCFLGPHHSSWWICSNFQTKNLKTLHQGILDVSVSYTHGSQGIVAAMRMPQGHPHSQGLSSCEPLKYKCWAVLRESTCNFFGQEFQGWWQLFLDNTPIKSIKESNNKYSLKSTGIALCQHQFPVFDNVIGFCNCHQGKLGW